MAGTNTEGTAPRQGAGHLCAEGDDLVAVYLPMSYMIGGYTVFLPRELIEPTSLSVEAGMRLALMGGVQGAPGAGASSSAAR